jgi:hypothetical protein
VPGVQPVKGPSNRHVFKLQLSLLLLRRWLQLRLLLLLMLHGALKLLLLLLHMLSALFTFWLPECAARLFAHICHCSC